MDVTLQRVSGVLRWVLIVWCALVFFDFVGVISHAVPPTQLEATQNTEQTRLALYIVFLMDVGRGFDRTVSFVHDNHDAIEAAATVAVAFFTFTLWRATDRLWVAGERQLSHLAETSQRELRAYATVHPHKRPWFDEHLRFHGTIRVTNDGQTPAYNVCRDYECVVLSNDDAESYQWKLLEPTPRDFTMHPGQAIAFDINVVDPGAKEQMITRENYDLIQNKKAKVWINGIIRYEDAFKKSRATRFRLYIGYFELRDFAYSTADEGNSSD